MDSTKLNDFATRYTAAWCSRDAASVASFFADQGSLKVNRQQPFERRVAHDPPGRHRCVAGPQFPQRRGDPRGRRWLDLIL
jgi:hypothetical protein